MSLPNNFASTNRKIFTFFQNGQQDLSQIETQKTEQELIEHKILSTVPTKTIFKTFTDLSFDWTDFQIYNTDEELGTRIAYQAWELTLRGLRFVQLSALQSNYVFRFGTGEPLLESNISESTEILTTENILSPSLDNTSDNEYIFYYGILLRNLDGIQEIDALGMQCKLQLTVFNPTSFS